MIYKIDNQQGPSVQHRELYTIFYIYKRKEYSQIHDRGVGMIVERSNQKKKFGKKTVWDLTSYYTLKISIRLHKEL